MSSLSGAAWWVANQGKYPNSNDINDLVSPFRENVMAFVTAIRDGGGQVGVTATRRDKRRAALMQYSWDVAHGSLDPQHVPAIKDVDIDWDHGNLAKSQAAANEMVKKFGIVFRPALSSLHIFGRAIDMNIGWKGTIGVKNKAGQVVNDGAPRDGSTNTVLRQIGAGYGVKKLLSDKPHWSDNGH